jgi:hypothetical protein
MAVVAKVQFPASTVPDQACGILTVDFCFAKDSVRDSESRAGFHWFQTELPALLRRKKLFS